MYHNHNQTNNISRYYYKVLPRWDLHKPTAAPDSAVPQEGYAVDYVGQHNPPAAPRTRLHPSTSRGPTESGP